MKKIRFYVQIVIIVLIYNFNSLSCKGQISTLDTVTVMRNSNTDTHCNKKLFFNSSMIGLKVHREIVANNHCSNLECSENLKHYRIVTLGKEIDLYISPKGKKEGHIHLTFLRSDSAVTIQSLTKKIVAIEIKLEKKTVNEAFHLIDSFQMDSIYNVQGAYAGYKEKYWRTHDNLSLVYEFATPEVYYFQGSPECEINNTQCMCWLDKLRKFTYYLNKLLEPYALPIEKLEQDMKKKNILKF